MSAGMADAAPSNVLMVEGLPAALSTDTAFLVGGPGRATRRQSRDERWFRWIRWSCSRGTLAAREPAAAAGRLPWCLSLPRLPTTVCLRLAPAVRLHRPLLLGRPVCRGDFDTLPLLGRWQLLRAAASSPGDDRCGNPLCAPLRSTAVSIRALSWTPATVQARQSEGGALARSRSHPPSSLPSPPPPFLSLPL